MKLKIYLFKQDLTCRRYKETFKNKKYEIDELESKKSIQKHRTAGGGYWKPRFGSGINVPES